MKGKGNDFYFTGNEFLIKPNFMIDLLYLI